ncbi:epidermal growth factor receptor substrate 15-like 1 [Arapaima gigas]
MSAFLSVSQMSGGNPTYENYYRQLDPLNTGRVEPGDAVDFLKRSGLADSTLGQVADLSSSLGCNVLSLLVSQQGFLLALRLVSAAQSGHEVRLSSLDLPTPPPTFKDARSPSPSTLPPTGSTPWAVTLQEKLKFDDIFSSLSPMNGLLSGDKVRPMLLNSGLPRDVLGKVWDLSDIDRDGHLDRDEFAVAMHLVQRSLQHEGVPSSLPMSLIPPSKRKKTGGILPGSVAVLPSSVLTLKDSLRRSPPLGAVDSVSSSLSPELPSNPQAVSWVVPAADRSRYDDLFLKTDTDLDGLVSGQEVKEILMQSGLPHGLLAHIWTLADTRQLGQLTKEQFSLAMHLVQQKVRHGVDPPKTLSPDMVPPSERESRIPDALGSLGSVGSVELTGIKELDDMSQEIAELQREKFLLQQEIHDQQEALRYKSNKLQEMQDDLEREANGLQQLEVQKQDAQQRLEEMNQQKDKLETMLSDVRMKVQEESHTVSLLQSQIQTQEVELRGQEVQLDQARAELDHLQQEEARLEQSMRSTRTRLDTVTSSLKTTQDNISKVRKNLSQIQKSQEETSQNVEKYSSILSDVIRGNTAALDNLNLSSSLVAMDNPFGTKELTSDPFQLEDPFKSDPFKDVFGDDPFKGSDPFGTSKVDLFEKLDKKEPLSPPERPLRSPFVSKVTEVEDSASGRFLTATPPAAAVLLSYETTCSLSFLVPQGNEPISRRHQSLVAPPKKGVPPRPSPPTGTSSQQLADTQSAAVRFSGCGQ